MKVALSLVLLPSIGLVSAWDFSIFSKAVQSAQQTLGLEPQQQQVEPEPVRVAIIGAGAGGSSAAYWIHKAKERHGMDIEVQIFDKNDYVGGRSITVHPYDDKSLPAIELGASIFVKANRNLYRAAEEFGLELRNLDDEDEDMGIWDGEKFVLTLSGGGWGDTLKILWRYGYSAPTKTKAFVTEMVTKLLKSYTPDLASWSSISELSERLDFDDLTAQTGLTLFTSKGINPLFTKELIDVATRVNYAQDIDAIQGLEALVSMAANGAFAIEGGNWQIFDEFIKRSGAQLSLNSTITGIKKSQVSGKTRWTLAGPSESLPATPFDHVIVSTPFHLSGITLLGSDADFLPPVDYIHLHVTIFSTTKSRPLAEKFGLPVDSRMPVNLYTTAEGARNGGPRPDFQSIGYLATFEHEGETQYAFKLFSLDAKSDEWFENLFGAGTLRWIHRKEWDSYPKLPPTTTFPPVKADDGLWYVNSMEPWISTMETETLSSRSLVDNLLRETFDHGVCPDSLTQEGWGLEEEPMKVYGWDC